MNYSDFPVELQAFIQEEMDGGRYLTIEQLLIDAVLSLRATQELRRMIQEGIDSSDRGESIDGDVVFAELRARAHELESRHP